MQHILYGKFTTDHQYLDWYILLPNENVGIYVFFYEYKSCFIWTGLKDKNEKCKNTKLNVN